MFNLRQLAALVVTTAIGASAFAAGYEKNIMWSGRHAGPAGTGAAWASGPEALYYNPAGIVTTEGSRSLDLNASLVTSQFKAPTTTANQTETAEREYYLVPGFFYGSTPSSKFGYAAGLYAAGGSRAHYGNMNVGVAGFTPTLKSEIEAVELSIGGAYKLSKDIKLGAGYRFGMVKAAFSSVDIVAVGTTRSVLNVDDLEGHQHGFRVGAQWIPEDKNFGAGISYRSPMALSLGGTTTGQIRGTVNGDFSPTATTVKTMFPAQITTGAFWDVVPEVWRAHVEHVYTQYSKNQKLVIDGLLTNPLTATTSDIPDIQQRWRDQHNIRLAGEFMRTKYPIRFGYVWSSGVENPDYARAVFAAPGQAHTFTLGTGRGSEKIDYNIAAEYIFVDKTANPVTSGIGSRGGDYSTSAIALHTGVTYKF